MRNTNVSNHFYWCVFEYNCFVVLSTLTRLAFTAANDTIRWCRRFRLLSSLMTTYSRIAFLFIIIIIMKYEQNWKVSPFDSLLLLHIFLFNFYSFLLMLRIYTFGNIESRDCELCETTIAISWTHGIEWNEKNRNVFQFYFLSFLFSLLPYAEY